LIRAVIFDFGNVLCFPPAADKITHAAAFCRMSEPAFLEAFWKERLAYDGGLLTPAAYWSNVTDEKFAEANLATLIGLEVAFWNEFDARPFAWMKKLRASRISLGMLSNLPQVLGEALSKTRYLDKPFFSHFDCVTLSYELRSVKPESKIYHYAADGLDVSPSDVLFLDDRPANVEGALDFGMQAELFTTWEDFRDRGLASVYGLPAAD
jgi:putative hydrolase of the HAD superfamily